MTHHRTSFLAGRIDRITATIDAINNNGLSYWRLLRKPLAPSDVAGERMGDDTAVRPDCVAAKLQSVPEAPGALLPLSGASPSFQFSSVELENQSATMVFDELDLASPDDAPRAMHSAVADLPILSEVEKHISFVAPSGP